MLLRGSSLAQAVHRPSVRASTVQPSVPAVPTVVRTQRISLKQQRSVVAQAAPLSKAEVAKDGWWTKDNPSNMKDVTSVQQLVDELADAGDKLVVVEFYAPWCNACKALFPKVCRMMEDHKDDVVFLKVSFEANKDMCKTMGVKVLPYFHFYRGGEGRVDAFSCTVSKIQKMKDAIDNYTSEFCSLEPSPGIPEFPNLHAHPDDKPTNLGDHAMWK